MALYEHIFLARQDVTQQQVEALTEQIKTKIASLGGAVTKVEPWGLKSLAYRIKKNRKAHFTLLNIVAPSEAIVELERTLGLDEDVIRYLTIRVDEHEAGPSAMLRKREESDRDDRGAAWSPRRSSRIAAIGKCATVGIAATIRRAVRVKTRTLERSGGEAPRRPLAIRGSGSGLRIAKGRRGAVAVGLLRRRESSRGRRGGRSPRSPRSRSPRSPRSGHSRGDHAGPR